MVTDTEENGQWSSPPNICEEMKLLKLSQFACYLAHVLRTPTFVPLFSYIYV